MSRKQPKTDEQILDEYIDRMFAKDKAEFLYRMASEGVSSNEAENMWRGGVNCLIDRKQIENSFGFALYRLHVRTAELGQALFEVLPKWLKWIAKR